MSAQPDQLIETITFEVRVPGEGDKPVSVAKATSSNDVHDVWAYRLAVIAIGAALVVFLIGIMVIVAAGKAVPSQYWTTGSAISGALLGILAPQPTTVPTQKKGFWGTLADGVAKIFMDLWNNRTVLILLAIFAVAVWRDLESHSTEWQALAAAAAGALIGLLSPSPAKKPS